MPGSLGRSKRHRLAANATQQVSEERPHIIHLTGCFRRGGPIVGPILAQPKFVSGKTILRVSKYLLQRGLGKLGPNDVQSSNSAFRRSPSTFVLSGATIVPFQSVTFELSFVREKGVVINKRLFSKASLRRFATL